MIDLARIIVGIILLIALVSLALAIKPPRDVIMDFLIEVLEFIVATVVAVVVLFLILFVLMGDDMATWL